MCDSFLTSTVTPVDTLKGKLSQRSYLWSTSKLDFSSSKQEKVNVLVMSTCVDDNAWRHRHKQHWVGGPESYAQKQKTLRSKEGEIKSLITVRNTPPIVATTSKLKVLSVRDGRSGSAIGRYDCEENMHKVYVLGTLFLAERTQNKMLFCKTLAQFI